MNIVQQVNILSPEFKANPFTLLARLRAEQPVCRARPEVQDAQVVACFLHIRARKLLRATLQMRARLRVLFAGRISGVEG